MYPLLGKMEEALEVQTQSIYMPGPSSNQIHVNSCIEDASLVN